MKYVRHGCRHAGFTLLELLVVVAVISILAAILLPTLNLVREQARATVSCTRIDEITRALATLAVAPGETQGFLIRKQLQEYQPAIVRGILSFRLDQRTLERTPAPSLSPSATPGTMQTWIIPPYRAYEFPHPWGSVPTDAPGDVVLNQTALAPGVRLPIENHKLSDLTPVLSAELIRISGTLDPGRFSEDATAWNAYRTQRRRDHPWNDAWGRPLLMSIAFYHPRKFSKPNQTRSDGTIDMEFADDQLFTSARNTYGYAQSVYVAGAAVGPRLPDYVTDEMLEQEASPWTTPATGILAQLWTHCNAVAGTVNGVELWRTDGTVDPAVNAMARPPWTGVRRARSSGRFCMLASPVEIR